MSSLVSKVACRSVDDRRSILRTIAFVLDLMYRQGTILDHLVYLDFDDEASDKEVEKDKEGARDENEESNEEYAIEYDSGEGEAVSDANGDQYLIFWIFSQPTMDDALAYLQEIMVILDSRASAKKELLSYIAFSPIWGHL